MESVSARQVKGSGASNNLAASTTFGPITVRGARLTIAASWTGTPTGTFALQASPDGVTWTTVPGAAAEFTSNSQSQPAGGAGSAWWTWYGLPGTLLQLVYTATSGTGTVTLWSMQGD